MLCVFSTDQNCGGFDVGVLRVWLLCGIKFLISCLVEPDFLNLMGLLFTVDIKTFVCSQVLDLCRKARTMGLVLDK